jgi:hypothetical protein
VILSLAGDVASGGIRDKRDKTGQPIKIALSLMAGAEGCRKMVDPAIFFDDD